MLKTLQSALSYEQQALYFLFQQRPADTSYNIGGAVRIKAAINPEHLSQSLQFLMKRHSLLRAFFLDSLAEPVFVIQPFVESPLSIIQADNWSEDVLRANLTMEFNRSFDLTGQVPFRSCLYQLSSNECVLQLTLHHIACDLWSFEILARELFQLLSDETGETRFNLPPLSYQYPDYIQRQQLMLSSQRVEEAEAYWERQLKDPLPLMNILTTHTNKSKLSNAGARYSFWIDEEITSSLRKQARAQKVTPFTIMLAAFQALLHRYSGQDDVIVGTPVNKRPAHGFRNVIGHFINPVAVRSSIHGDLTFANLVQQLRQTIRDALTHSAYPFPMLLNRLQPVRNPSGPPIFQYLFAWGSLPAVSIRNFEALSANVSGIQAQLPGFSVESVGFDRLSTQFDLSLSVIKYEDQFLCLIDYDTDLFEINAIDRLSTHFQNILLSISNDSSIRICDIPLLTDRERNQFDELNNTTTHWGEELLVHKLFESQVLRSKDLPAVTFQDNTLTYEDLNARAEYLASYLRSFNLPPESPVTLILEPSLEVLIAIIAILKAGAAFVPLNPSESTLRLSQMLQDIEPPLIITTTALSNKIDSPEPVLYIDTIWKNPVEPERETEIVPGNLAYVIYTSGSTGTPKGVMITHQAICNRLLWMRDQYDINKSDCVLFKTPYTFDVAVWEIFLPLISGARLVISKPNGNIDPLYLAALIKQENITTIHFVPSMLNFFLAEDAVSDIACLRRVFSSGEPLSPYQVAEFSLKLRAEIHNLYGPTEAAVDVTFWDCQTLKDVSTIPIGYPISNTGIYILDSFLNQVPIGQPGQLYIGGMGLARGYWNKADLTAERFIPNPFPCETSARLYKTGDQVRFRPDGSIEYLGRLDRQVKIRGVRVEIQEVESALIQHPHIKDALVAPFTRGYLETALVAYLIPNIKDRLSINDLRQFLRDRLPEQFIPTIFIFLEAFPLTQHGKLDYGSLPSPSIDDSYIENPFVEPGTLQESSLARIWQDVLGVERIGINDDFFKLGGDSLRSLQLRIRARQIGYDFTVQDIFEAPTIEQLALRTRVIESIEERHLVAEPFALLTGKEQQALLANYEDAFPLSRLQEGLVYHSLYDAGYKTYVLSLHLKAKLDPVSLDESLHSLATRHEMLRTSYVLNRFDRPLQVVHKIISLTSELHDMRDRDADEQERIVDELIESESRSVFDWERAPLIRIRIDRRTDSSFQMTITHPLFDGWSLAILLTELLTEYLDRIGGRQIAPVSLPLSRFKSLISAEQAALQSEETKKYWENKLSFCKPSILAFRSIDSRTTTCTERLVVKVPAKIAEGIKRLSRYLKVPLKSILLAAHLQVVGQMTGQTDVITGIIVNGRVEEPDGDKVVGMFLNTVPLRCDIAQGTWVDQIHRTFRAEQEIWPHRHYPLAEIKAMRRGLPFNTVFNFIHFHIYDQIKERNDIELTDWKNPSDQTYFAFCAYFNLDPLSSELYLYLDFDSQHFTLSQMKDSSSYYISTLEIMAEHASECIINRSLSSEKELSRQGPARKHSASRAEQVDEIPFYRLFEDWARRTPDAIAIRSNISMLTYFQLNERANRLSRRLQSLGVGPEVTVGMLLPRGPEMLVALIAILKTGGAYIPLDPSHPASRVNQVLIDSQTQIVIIEEEFNNRFSPDSSEIIAIALKKEDFSEYSGNNLIHTADMNSLAYLIYTSGSTGVPKGVEISHRSLLNLFQAIKECIGIDQNDIMLAVTPLTFDISALELFLPLIVGGSIILADENEMRNAEKLINIIEESNPTIMQATPSTWQMLIEAKWYGASALRLLSGGDILPAKLAGLLLEKGQVLWNLYGPTETTIWTSACEILPDSAPPALGTPLVNTSMYILDQELNPVPVGVSGELHVGGLGLARGYRNQPSLTAECFVPDPFSNDGGRLYKTGDQSRLRADGNIEFTGRLDYQLKIRGFRIELQEIESCLSLHPSVYQASVIAKNLGPDDVRLCAFVRPQEGYQINAEDLRKHLSETIPHYMVPGKFIEVDVFPLTPNGKIDRTALAEQLPDRPQRSALGQIHLTQMQESILLIWRDILQREDIGLDDNFFEVGGHSLLLMRVCSSLQAKMQRSIPLTHLFQYSTIRLMANYLDNIGATRGPVEEGRNRARARKQSRASRNLSTERRRKVWDLS